MRKIATYLIWVPRPRVFPLGSLETVKEEASDSHTHCSSLWFLEVTTTVSATRKAE